MGTVPSTFLRWMTSLCPGWNWFLTLRSGSFSGVQVLFSRGIPPVFLACVLRLFPLVLQVVSFFSRLIVSPGVPVVSFLHSKIVSPCFPSCFLLCFPFVCWLHIPKDMFPKHRELKIGKGGI